MAILEHWKTHGKVFRAVEVFRNRRATVSMRGQGQALCLSYRSPESDEADPQARTYRVELDTTDLREIVDRMVNPSYTLGYFIGEGRDSELDFRDLLASVGLHFDHYRYPSTKRRGEYVYVQAVNEAHALYQLGKLERLIVASEDECIALAKLEKVEA